jgi:hypothetical protein
MQVVCGNCQLSFDAPEGATGLVCPICRSPLRAQSADGAAAKADRNVIEWNAGDLDDLIAVLSGPAVSARVEVLPAVGDVVAGEVHLLAGGVSDALIDGKSVDDALDRLRAVKPARFRIEGRLPNPADGDLSHPGPDAGTLEGRALAHLMRYCEDYVITCAIEVWRGNENARVEYKRGEINGVTVGGIDAPERLAEVMLWASGNYRLVVPPIEVPAVAPKRAPAPAATPAPVPAPAPSAQAARGSATKTIFGMPAAEVMKARAAAEAAKVVETSKTTESGRQTVIVTPAQAPAAAPTRTATPAPLAASAPASAAAPPAKGHRPSATKTMFGVPAPDAATLAAVAPEPAAPVAEERPEPSSPAPADRKTGARKVSVPAPDLSAPVSVPAPAPAPAQAPARAAAAVSGPTRAETTEPVRRYPTPAPTPAQEAPRPAKKEVSILAYVGVGITFGVALLGIYHLVGMLSH